MLYAYADMVKLAKRYIRTCNEKGLRDIIKMFDGIPYKKALKGGYREAYMVDDKMYKPEEIQRIVQLCKDGLEAIEYKG